MGKTELLELITDLNCHFGKKVAMSGDDIPNVRKMLCKLPAVDFAAGGGIPINRISEFYGAPSSCKTLAALKVTAQFQRFDWRSYTPEAILSVTYKKSTIKAKAKEKGSEAFEQAVWVEDEVTVKEGIKSPRIKRVAWVDFEGTYDPEWGERQGVDTKALLHVVPTIASEGVDIIDSLLRSPDISLVVVDSVSAAGADAEIEASMEDDQMGLNARFWNKAMRKFQSAINSNPEQDITLLLINRPYSKVGMVFGSPEEIGGGSGIKFGKSLSLRFAKVGAPQMEKVEGREEITGQNFEVKCLKSKVGRPFKSANFNMSFIETARLYAGETDIPMQLVEIGIRSGLITVSGAWLQFESVRSQGREKFVDDLLSSGSIGNLEKQLFI